MLLKTLMVCACAWVARGYSDLEKDPLDFEKIARSPALLRQMADCLTDNSPCTPDEQLYKNHAQESIKDGCHECERRQKHFGHVFLSALARDLPQQYRQLRDKYDPQGRAFPALLKEIDKY